MYLIDSNILIYSAKPDFNYLRPLIARTNFVSIISKLEVLGFHKLTERDKIYFDACFKLLSIIHTDVIIFEKAIEIRRLYNLSIGDSLISATALVNDFELITHNTADFKRVASLKISNPII